MQEDLRLKNTPYWSHGYHFLKWGLWFFIVGIILGFGVLIHYLVGSAYNNTGEFLSNITLWFGSPLTLSTHFLQIGGLGMAILGGLCHFIANCCSSDASKGVTDASGKYSNGTVCTKHKHAALTWCVVGLIALFITGYIGYFIIDFIWPAFYYTPLQGPKNLWLILQGLSILCYLIGFIMATCCLCKCKREHQVNSNVRV